MICRAFIGLGSNLGDRGANLQTALNLVAASDCLTIERLSSILETAPVDYLEQPHFLNQMALVETSLSPDELLKTLQDIEAKMGRQETIPKGPRLIDLDIILYGSLVVESANLIIPHPERFNRVFIIRHLAELDPKLQDPVSGEFYNKLAG
ncbi:MAG: 2-amino-4-hydroxy-6-hydroxymethyldihydropteridine diphosphokinase [Leptospirales bacterium]|nr:2-amino-4-hydroxy-6-hydroxymethyldihydropteridine diphosphokinase [Leptospirales bacterium]